MKKGKLFTAKEDNERYEGYIREYAAKLNLPLPATLKEKYDAKMEAKRQARMLKREAREIISVPPIQRRMVRQSRSDPPELKLKGDSVVSIYLTARTRASLFRLVQPGENYDRALRRLLQMDSDNVTEQNKKELHSMLRIPPII